MKVDAVTTGGLDSGKQEAKANRKDLNKRAEALAVKVQEAKRCCDRIAGGDVAGGAAEAQRLHGEAVAMQQQQQLGS